jgi:RHS repeat-associated protein
MRFFDTWFYYDNLAYGQVGPKAELTRLERWHEDGNVNLYFGHHPIYGSLTSRTDEENHVTTLQYGLTDPTYTFLDQESTTTTGGGPSVTHVTSYTYDKRFGFVTTTSSTDSPTVSSEYDVFGRATKSWTSSATSQLPNLCFQYDLLARPIRVTRFDREVYGAGEACGSTGMIGTSSFIDGLGRTVEMKSETSETGNQSTVTGAVSFNSEGRVQAVKQPFFSTDLVTVYTVPASSLPERTATYDPLGRPETLTLPGSPARIATTVYSAWTTQHYDFDGNRRDMDFNAFGRILSGLSYTKSGASYSLYATTTYDYDNMGRLRHVIDDTNQPQLEYRYDKLGRQSYIYDRDGGAVDVHYWKDGVVKSTSDAEQRTKNFDYDELHRVLQLTRSRLGTTEVVQYRYDEASHGLGAVGHLTSAEDFSTGVRDDFSYDQLGRQYLSRRRLDGYCCYEFSRALDALNRTQSLTYPDGTQVIYQFGVDGHVNAVNGFATNLKRTPEGFLQHIEYSNGLGVDWTYDPVKRWLTGINAKKLVTGSPDVVNMQYGYTTGGHLLSTSDSVATDDQSFGLDDFYRLASANGAYGSLGYSYDVLGNITAKGSRTFEYTDSAHPHRAQHTRVQGNPELDLGYDLTGIITSAVSSVGVGWLYDPDIAGRLWRARNSAGTDVTEYVYGPDGDVTKRTRTINGTPTATLLVGGLYEKSGASFKKYIEVDGRRFAEWRSDGTKYFYVSDHLGSMNVVTDQSAAVVQRIEYAPYGEISTIQSPTFGPTYTYGGARQDDGPGLYDFGARLYHPALARFLSVDPVVSDSLNPYAYAAGNPVERVDLGGYSSGTAVIGLVVGLAVTAATMGNAPAGVAASQMVAAAVAGGAAGGAVSGGLSAMEQGASPWRAALVGAAVGAGTSWAVSGITAAASSSFASAPAGHLASLNLADIGAIVERVSVYATSGMGALSQSIAAAASGVGMSALVQAHGSCMCSSGVPSLTDAFQGLTAAEIIDTGFKQEVATGAVIDEPAMEDNTFNFMMAFTPARGATSIMGRLAASAEAEAVTVGEYTLTKTVAGHLEERLTTGELTRPFLRSPLTIGEIIKEGTPVTEATGALRYTVPGTFRGSTGTWELVVEPNTKTIFHYNFVTPSTAPTP